MSETVNILKLSGREALDVLESLRFDIKSSGLTMGLMQVHSPTEQSLIEAHKEVMAEKAEQLQRIIAVHHRLAYEVAEPNQPVQ